MKLLKIVSGGQTGADRAALDWAMENRITYGGWCPKGRRAEDGIIPARYFLQGTPGEDYPQRTEWNVLDSDGTVVISISPLLSGGARKTVTLANKHGRPVLHLSKERDGVHAAAKLVEFLCAHRIIVLNVAGPRASEEPQIARFVKEVLKTAAGIY